jgi:hypothetical protein
MLLGNQEIFQAFSLLENKKLTIENAVPTLFEKQEFNKDISAEILYISQHFYSIDKDEIFKIDLDIIKRIITHPKLIVRTEDSLLEFIAKLIEKKGDEYKELLTYVKYEIITESCSKLIDKYITTETLHKFPELWESLTKRLTLQTSSVRIPDRYVHKEIQIPFCKDKPFSGIFSYISSLIKGANPVEAGEVDITLYQNDCNVSPATLMNYNLPPSRWNLTEIEDNWICFDFKKARVSMNAYTISSGTDSSYWEYPVSFTWEGSNDKFKWHAIDVRDNDTEMGGNEKTHTWNLNKMSPLFRYIRFRLRNVTRRGGLYTPRMELFGAYKPPE